jgi:hypothetical protein
MRRPPVLRFCRAQPSPFFLRQARTSAQRYLQPPFVEPVCVSGHCAPQPRFSSAIIWGAYDMWMFRGSRAWSQWGGVHRFHVLLACRKFWFSNIIEAEGADGALPGSWRRRNLLGARTPLLQPQPGVCGLCQCSEPFLRSSLTKTVAASCRGHRRHLDQDHWHNGPR